MNTLCPQCHRLNPSGASYCYFDGLALDGHSADVPVDGSAINVGARPFSSPFVFPSGRACHNFNQLALGCFEEEAAAIAFLRDGHLERFLAGMGRTDLAQAARLAARATDPARGLDELLGKLPAAALLPAQLRVEPAEIDLGAVPVGEDRTFTLTLGNEGMRLLHGSVSCGDTTWLLLGSKAGARQKLFQTSDQVRVVVRVVGKNLRAYAKPQEASLLIESSGGKAEVPVRLRVPLVPFPEGVLAGALTPRQLAAKAKAHPTEAAPLIENGAVARWYASNGWTYPIRGPAASGVAAIQQLFEALGLVSIPHVDLAPSCVTLSGNAGDRLESVLAVVTQENRAAVAHGKSDQPWLQTAPTIFRGRTATIPLIVPAVPDRPGETLEARVRVTANGNQRFVVPVTLAVGLAFGRPAVSPPPRRPATPLPATPPASPPVATPPPLPEKAVPVPVPALPAPLGDWLSEGTAKEKAAPLPAPPLSGPPSVPAARRKPWPAWVHVLPPLLLVLGFLVALGRDLFFRGVRGEGEADLLDLEPRLILAFHDAPDNLIGATTMTFGVTLAREKDPANPQRRKKLTFDSKGRTSNVCYRVDGQGFLLGYGDGGRWAVPQEDLGKDTRGRDRTGRRSVWEQKTPPLTIAQEVEIISGGQSRLLDTCLVRYRIENRDKNPHKVGLRFLLDTFIGARDGVPFALPGRDRLCDTKEDLSGAAVPDFLQALERDDLADPGTVAHVSLKPGGGLEAPGRVTLGSWPDPRLDPGQFPGAAGPQTGWEVPLAPIKTLKEPDSAVTLYWAEKELPAGGRREMGFAYGLGTVAGEESGGRLGVTVGGSFEPGGEFTVTAYVKAPLPGETLTLELPAGLERIAGDARQVVPAAAGVSSSPVSWRVRSANRDRQDYRLEVKSSGGVSQKRVVRIRGHRLF